MSRGLPADARARACPPARPPLPAPRVPGLLDLPGAGRWAKALWAPPLRAGAREAGAGLCGCVPACKVSSRF